PYTHTPTGPAPLYSPLPYTTLFRSLGFCNPELKLFGPLHAYVAPATAGVLSVSVAPAQIGPLLLATGVAGTALTVAVVLTAHDRHPATDTAPLHIPLSTQAALAMLGFCNAEMTLFGLL